MTEGKARGISIIRYRRHVVSTVQRLGDLLAVNRRCDPGGVYIPGYYCDWISWRLIQWRESGNNRCEAQIGRRLSEGTCEVIVRARSDAPDRINNYPQNTPRS